MIRMTPLALLLLLLPSCSAVDPATPDPSDTELSWRILASGATSRATPAPSPAGASAPRLEIARSDAEYQQLWARHIGSGTPTPAAFDEETVVFLLGGMQSTGGYEIDPRDVVLQGDRLVIDAAVEGPPPGSMVTQAFAAPWTLLAVNRRQFVEAQWVEGGQIVARREPLDTQ